MGELGLDDLEFEAQRALDDYALAGNLLADFAADRSPVLRTQELSTVLGRFADLLAVDRDLLATIASIQQVGGEYLYDHAVNVALLSMTIADQAHCTREQIQEVGLGAIFQDVGMIRVPESIRLAERPITHNEWIELSRHPIHTIDILERIPGLPPLVRFIGYQVHERGDGSGYPRGRRVTGIHPFARIVAIADVFSAMTRPRPHRTALPPHDVIRQILYDGRANQLDRAYIRTFLDRLSVFPIGCHVELNNGMIGRVVRANPGKHTRPLIVEVDGDGDSTGLMIDLALEPELEVVAVPTLEQILLKNPPMIAS